MALYHFKIKSYILFCKGGIIGMQIIIALIGICAAALLLWYVYILMRGDTRV